MPRLRKFLFLAISAVLLLLVFLYDVVRSIYDPGLAGLAILREVFVLTSFAAIVWYVLHLDHSRGRIGPKEMGRILAFGFAVLSILAILSMIPGLTRIDEDAGFRFTSLGIFFGTIISILLISFATYLLFALREMVLFKKRPSTRRNLLFYEVLLGLVAVTSIEGMPYSDSIIGSVLFASAVAAALVITFRQNWIVYLSRKEKIFALVYSSLLVIVLILLSAVLSKTSFGSRALTSFSRPLHELVQLNCIFGAMYFGMSFVSTLFHLPTSEVFERKQSELTSLHALSRLVTQVFDFDKLSTTVTQMTLEVCGAKSSWLEILEEDPLSGEVRTRIAAKQNIRDEEIASLNDLSDNAPRRLLLESKKARLVDDVWNDARTKHVKQAGVLRGSLLSVPLQSHDKMIGILHAAKEMENGFDQEDIDVLSTFADHVAIAIDNSTLIAKSFERERLKQEMMVAQRMQKRLLPSVMPEDHRFELAAISESSLEVGGDYYDVIPLSNDRLGLVIGDVSGKGVSAAFYMAVVKGIFLSLSELLPSPKQLLIRANETLKASLEKKAFVSLIYGILDIGQGELVYARAGHCPIIHLSDGKANMLRPDGIGLGLTGGEQFSGATEEMRIRSAPGDVCVLYTDGITEASNAAYDEFGYERLVAAIESTKQASANEIKNCILHAVQAFSGDSVFADDMTLIVLKWNGDENA